MKSHIAVHKNIREKVECPVCNKDFYRFSNFESHMVNSHSGEDIEKYVLKRKYVVFKVKIGLPTCDLCNKSFKRNENLQNHIFRYHKTTTQTTKVKCQSCPKLFGRRADLNKHMRKFHQVSHYRCFVISIV